MYKPTKANIIMIILILFVANIKTNVNALDIKYDKSTTKCIINKQNYAIDKVINTVTDNKTVICTAASETNIEIEDEVNTTIEQTTEETTTEIEEEYTELVYVNDDIYYERAANYLTASKGVVYFEGHKETYYTEESLPGYGLNIPGRHVAYDGTIRDIDSYIVVAANSSYLAKGSIINTSLGLAKVYDTGCAYGTIDIYVNNYKFSTYQNINLLDI